jgi:hypothetical protein
MLDCYLLGDTSLEPDEPNEEHYLESFSLTEFEYFHELSKKLKGQEISFTFFSDFRLTSRQVNIVLENIIGIDMSNNSKKLAYKKLIGVLVKLKTAEQGMFCFCD